ncbi:MAG: hypothetical protein EOM34_05020 [Clostridia bacterium]|nr:hypothetical protein [Clostridia bacterium]NCD01878.1 hypothetical protein [Clostridia bacterium]
MLNEDKIRVMSRCAMYEKGQGKEDLAINRYYQGDYVRLNMLKTLIGVTVGFVICFGLYLVLRAEYYMENIVGMDLMAFGRTVLICYVVVMIIFAAISIIFYGWKYADTQKRVRWYYKDLKAIEEIEKAQDKMNLTEDIA